MLIGALIMPDLTKQIIVRQLGRQIYQPVWQAMQQFTQQRNNETLDELWLVEHDPVFTQGQAGKAEHILMPSHIPVVQVDRGGQVTYHGPGQLVIYCLIDLKRKNLGVRQLVSAIENSVVNLLQQYQILSAPRSDAPGVYVANKKICSLGLKIKKGCSFHGLALNVDMDLSPFTQINPCGYADMQVTQLADIINVNDVKKIDEVGVDLVTMMMACLGYADQINKSTIDFLPD